MLWQLFWSFFKIGVMSFGGGYAMIPVIHEEVAAHGWLTEGQYAEAVALAGMAPGPIATNSAIIVGYEAAGFAGSIMTAFGILLPSVIIIVLSSMLFHKVYLHKKVKSAFYGLRPIIAALVFYGAFRLALSSPHLRSLSWETLFTCIIGIVAFVAMLRYHLHPMLIIGLSALLGIALFS